MNRKNKKGFSLFLFALLIGISLTACTLPRSVDAPAPNPEASGTQIELTVVAGIQLTAQAIEQTERARPPTETTTPTATTAPTATNTSEPAATNTPEAKPVVSVSVDTNCRQGPGEPYDIVTGLLVGQEAEIVGVPEFPMDYLIIKNPNTSDDCWLWLQYAAVQGNLDAVPEVLIPASPTPAPGSIGGIVWNDKCKLADDGDPPPGCINPPVEGNPYIANGILEPTEKGFKGVVLQLGAGACPSTGVASTTTAADGTYLFDNVLPGTYCVSINPLGATNSAILIPGGWSFPNLSGAVTVEIGHNEDINGISFGWDFQLD